MENLTNFDTLIYIYIAMTMGTLIYPVQLWFRVNFVNFIFMTLLASFVLMTKIDISWILNQEKFFSSQNIEFLMINISIAVIGITYFRVNQEIVKLDGLFLGYLPFIFFFEIILLLVKGDTMDMFLLNMGFFSLYSVFIYEKLMFILPFSVNSMANRK